jgi:hypothetical protein
MKSLATDERVFCPDCHRATEVVLNHATGDTICTECALVLDVHFIDEVSEWRTFSTDAVAGGDDRDPSCIGSTGDPSSTPSSPPVPRMLTNCSRASERGEIWCSGFRGEFHGGLMAVSIYSRRSNLKANLTVSRGCSRIPLITKLVRHLSANHVNVAD